MAFGLFTGEIYIYKTKSNHNILTADPKSDVINADSKQIRSIFFSKIENQLNMFYTTEENVYIRLDMNKSKKLDSPGGNVFDIT